MGIVDNLMTHPATITKRGRTGATDSHGIPLVQETSGATTVCYLDQSLTGQRAETTAGREAEELGYTAYFPAGIDLDGTDSVTIDGVEFEVIGPPWYARNPLTDEVDHAELTLRATTG